MRTISIINLKGGVAKTISSTCIAHTLATEHKKRVLLIDSDKQGNATATFGLHSYDHKSLSDILTARHPEDPTGIIRQTQYQGLDIIPANMGLLKANLEVLLDMSRPQQPRLKKALEFVSPQYDYCIIDHAPDINMANINGLVATDDVLIPVKVDKYAFDGLEFIAEQIEEIRDYNPGIRLLGCFMTMYTGFKFNREGGEWLRKTSPYPVFDTTIRRTTLSDESTAAEKPLTAYSRRCTASQDYRALVTEYLGMLEA